MEEGLLKINGTDMASLGCFLYEENAGDHTNYDSLMKPPKMKEHTSVSYRELDGEELPETLLPRYEARDITLKMAVVADTRAGWFESYNAVLALLKSGWLTLEVPEIGRDEGLPEGIYPVQPVHDNQEYRPAGSRIHGHAARAETFFNQ